jgi:hypothetical protein
MRENLMSGSTGGRWKRGNPAGHPRVPGRCAEKRHHKWPGRDPARWSLATAPALYPTWALLQVHVVSRPQTYQRPPGSLGHAEVQAVAPSLHQGGGVAGWRRPTRASPLRPLEGGDATRRLDNGSRMSCEVHVRFCESRRVRFPPATLLVIICPTRQRAEEAQRLVG